MLTHNDRTVENAYQIFEQCKASKVKFWGFKEKPLSLEESKQLYRYMKRHGKTTFLEVVAYTEKEGIEGAKMAAACGCDVLLGTKFFDSVNKICQEKGLKYMPFVGDVTGRPSILDGTAEEMIREARDYLAKGVYGLDLLGYRYTKDPVYLIKKFVSAVDAPVCVAGSINSCARLDEIKDAAPWTFTIGGAFFENKFGKTFSEQIDRVYAYMRK